VRLYENVFATVGVYPHEDLDKDIGEIGAVLSELIDEDRASGANKIVGIGECGIDIPGESQAERESLKKKFIGDVKKRIDEISSKYILVDEGTTDFAVMYVPSENIYYELVVNTPEIEDYSREKNVFITSPNTLNYQMKAILVAYQQSQLQKHAGEILKSLSGIKMEAEKFDEELGLLSGHIARTYKAMDGVKIKFARLFGKIERTQALGTSEEPKKISPES